MNNLELINQFWAKDAEYQFSDKETALYFYLLNACKSSRWRNPFGLSGSVTMAKFGWGKTSFERARNRLKEAGLIDFRRGIGRGNIHQYIIREKAEEFLYEEVAQTTTIFSQTSEKGIEKECQKEGFPEQILENGLEKGYQTPPFYSQFSEKGLEKGYQITPFYGEFSEKGLEKGYRMNTFYGQFSEKGYQTTPFFVTDFASEALKIETFQKILNENQKFNYNNIITNIDKIKDNDNKDDINLKKEKSEKKEKTVAQKENCASKNGNEVLELYRTVCRSFPQIMQITGRRKEKILRRLSEMGGIKILEQVFRKMEASDFLKGNNKVGWKATFDWVFKNPENWMKILEGNYDNHSIKPANDARFMGMLQTDLSKF